MPVGNYLLWAFACQIRSVYWLVAQPIKKYHFCKDPWRKIATGLAYSIYFAQHTISVFKKIFTQLEMKKNKGAHSRSQDAFIYTDVGAGTQTE